MLIKTRSTLQGEYDSIVIQIRYIDRAMATGACYETEGEEATYDALLKDYYQLVDRLEKLKLQLAEEKQVK